MSCQVEYWKNKATILQKLVDEQKRELDKKSSDINSILSTVFSPGQIQAIHLGPKWKKHIRWSAEDISSAISLQSVSSKAYRYLSKKCNFPLPSATTLCRWAQQMSFKKGFIEEVFAIMYGKVEHMSTLERIAVISFDEMYLSKRIEFEPKSEQILGPCNNVQVMCARGLFSQWKQPIFFEFNCDMTVNILLTAIKKMYDAGFIVVAFVSDLGSKNRTLHKELQLTPSKPYFEHPNIDGGKIFAFADVPHLLKLIRNHFLDSTLNLADGSVVDKEPITKLMSIQTSHLRPAWKLTNKIMEVKGTERQNVNSAAKLLSWNTSKALLWAGDTNLLNDGGENYKATSLFIELVNAWFDVHNSTNQYGSHSGVHGYGVNLEQQNDVLQKMSSVVEGMRVGKHTTILPFQHGILLSNASLQQIFPYLQFKHPEIKYIITRKLNQDILENMFSYLRGMGHTFDNPGPLEFMRRLKKYILGKHSSAVFSSNKNTKEDVTSNNLSADLLMQKRTLDHHKCQQKETEIVLTHDVFNDILDGKDIDYDSFEYSNIEEIHTDQSTDLISDAGLKYISGFVAHHFKGKYQLGESTKTYTATSECPEWILYASKGNLIVPSAEMLQAAKLMETMFKKIHGNSFCKEDNIIKKVVNACLDNGDLPIPLEVLRYMVRTRTYIMVRALNAKQTDYYQKSKQSKKKLDKIIN